MYSGPKVTMEQVLNSREARAARQNEWLESYSLPIISFTINMVGDVKRNHISQQAFDQGCLAILETCQIHDFSLYKVQRFELDTGFELLVCVGVDSARSLKEVMVTIEDTHPLGRLFDIDVLDKQGRGISRETLGLARRKCLLCDAEAKVCARSRAHHLDQLKDKMCEMINDSV
ncbi:citrate lyase holo-[acyl-carrier protein] synthase [Vibrio sp. WXL103]|uniref:citrate lyase holo-[acyl-carrier protein] synthase n=1 Tax=Vibrio sp. WXL103 TaxID=3450710 RepID=UPI003EC863B9